jgi:hypothetical protein
MSGNSRRRALAPNRMWNQTPATMHHNSPNFGTPTGAAAHDFQGELCGGRSIMGEFWIKKSCRAPRPKFSPADHQRGSTPEATTLSSGAPLAPPAHPPCRPRQALLYSAAPKSRLGSACPSACSNAHGGPPMFALARMEFPHPALSQRGGFLTASHRAVQSRLRDTRCRPAVGPKRQRLEDFHRRSIRQGQCRRRESVCRRRACCGCAGQLRLRRRERHHADPGQCRAAPRRGRFSGRAGRPASNARSRLAR